MNPCNCGAYTFPHRQGGGDCELPTEKRQAFVQANNERYYREIAESYREMQSHLTVQPVVASCPECGSLNVDSHHHSGSWAVPECCYMECEDCDHQWGHE